MYTCKHAVVQAFACCCDAQDPSANVLVYDVTPAMQLCMCSSLHMPAYSMAFFEIEGIGFRMVITNAE